MKRWFLIIFACLFAVLCACGKQEAPSREDMQQPVLFYYRASDESSFRGDTGGLGWEYYDLGAERLSAREILSRYLAGPYGGQLSSPFPSGLRLHDVTLTDDGILVIDCGDSIRRLNGVERTVAAAALVRTMTQFSGIDAVRILCDGAELSNGWSEPMIPEQFLLVDDTATSNASTIKLYFSDHDGKYLVEELRNRSFDTETEVPAYIVKQILDGPREDNRRPTMPDGTRLLGIQITNGICTLNFSEDFLRNRPETHKRARMAVYSVVNSLTELAEVESVRFLCDGNDLTDYAGLDLSAPVYRDDSVLGTALEQDKAIDMTLYVPSMTQARLAPVPVVIRRTTGRTLEADLLNALIARTDLNHYSNPIPEGTMVVDVNVKEGLCELTLNSAFVVCDNDPEQAKLAVRSIVTTLCGLDSVDRVRLSIHNGKLSSVDISRTMTEDPDWVLP